MFEIAYYALPVCAVRSMPEHVQYIMCGMQYAQNTQMTFYICQMWTIELHIVAKNAISDKAMHSTFHFQCTVILSAIVLLYSSDWTAKGLNMQICRL